MPSHLGPSFAIEPDTVDRISVDNGDQVKVHAEGTLRGSSWSLTPDPRKMSPLDCRP